MRNIKAALMAAVLGTLVPSEPAAAMALCRAGPRVDCVVDGDTIWIAREKIRIESIDAPEMEGGCRGEREAALAAAHRLAELLSGSEIAVTRSGIDRYGRTLATIVANGRDVGAVLVKEGHARVWHGRREAWCSG